MHKRIYAPKNRQKDINSVNAYCRNIQFAQMWHKAILMELPMRLELTLEGLLV